MSENLYAVKDNLAKIVNAVKEINITVCQFDIDLEKFGISSIEFIKIIVDCEMSWNIEFEPDKLSMSYFKNFNHMAQYILELIECIK